MVLVTARFSRNAASHSPSVYFTKGYGEATAVGATGEWMNLSGLEGDIQMPLILTPLGQGGFEASSPYGYSGIYASPAVSSDSLSVTWEKMLEALKLHGVVSLFLRFAPFDVGAYARFSELEGLSLTYVSDTISVPTLDSAAVWSGMQGRARTAIRKAERLGMTGAVESAASVSLAAGGAFRTLYEDTMRRVDAASHHFYPDAYYEALRDSLGDLLQLATVRNAEGTVVAAALMLVDEDIVHYHLSGSNPIEARNGANNLLIWRILQWSAENRYGSAHLGGGTSAEDSLYKFKASFGGTPMRFMVGKAVVAPDRYGALVQERAKALGCSAEGLLASEYFPAFRAARSLNVSD